MVNGQIKSSPAVEGKSHEGSICTSKIAKNCLIGQKRGCCTVLINVFQGQTKVFLGCKGHTWAGTIEQSIKNYQVWSHEGSTFFKKGPQQVH